MFPGLPEITVAQLLQRLVAGAVVLSVYGFVATRAAAAAGDQGPKHDGRLTFSPIPHLDVLGLVAMLFFRGGWMRPLAIDSREFTRQRHGALLVIASATVSLVALAVLAHTARQFALRLFDFDVGITVSTILLAISDLAVGTAVLGLLPIPPLLGSLWWCVARPGAERLSARPRVVLAGYAVLVVVLLSGVMTPVFRTLSAALARLFGF